MKSVVLFATLVVVLVGDSAFSKVPTPNQIVKGLEFWNNVGKITSYATILDDDLDFIVDSSLLTVFMAMDAIHWDNIEVPGFTTEIVPSALTLQTYDIHLRGLNKLRRYGSASQFYDPTSNTVFINTLVEMFLIDGRRHMDLYANEELFIGVREQIQMDSLILNATLSLQLSNDNLTALPLIEQLVVAKDPVYVSKHFVDYQRECEACDGFPQYLQLVKKSDFQFLDAINSLFSGDSLAQINTEISKLNSIINTKTKEIGTHYAPEPDLGAVWGFLMRSYACYYGHFLESPTIKFETNTGELAIVTLENGYVRGREYVRRTSCEGKECRDLWCYPEDESMELYLTYKWDRLNANFDITVKLDGKIHKGKVQYTISDFENRNDYYCQPLLFPPITVPYYTNTTGSQIITRLNLEVRDQIQQGLEDFGTDIRMELLIDSDWEGNVELSTECLIEMYPNATMAMQDKYQA